MRVAKYWRNNKLRYRLMRSAEAEGRKRIIRHRTEEAPKLSLRRAAFLKAETA